MDETLAMRIGAIRRLFTTEGSLFRDHLLRLDAAGRRDRFMSGVAVNFSFAMPPSVSPARASSSAFLSRTPFVLRENSMRQMTI